MAMSPIARRRKATTRPPEPTRFFCLHVWDRTNSAGGIGFNVIPGVVMCFLLIGFFNVLPRVLMCFLLIGFFNVLPGVLMCFLLIGFNVFPIDRV